MAQGYDRATAMVASQVNEAVLDAVGTGPGISLLDVACGPGWLSEAALKRGAVVTALDHALTTTHADAVECGAASWLCERNTMRPSPCRVAGAQHRPPVDRC
jgi:cyclopropane fatty-acyl-phospholipid synthase-like methyltransferase